MRQRLQKFKNVIFAVAFLCAVCGLGTLSNPLLAKAEDTATATKVEVTAIDYEAGTLSIKTNNNTKVFFSDSTQKTWTQVEGNAGSGMLTMDISWISVNKDYELNLKGSEDETVVPVELPACNKSLKVTFDKVDGGLIFSNEDGAETFEWKKASGNGAWKSASVDLSKDNSDFKEQIEMMRVRGGKISVRIPQTTGTSDSAVGNRPSKTVTVSITKRGNAPSVKVKSSSLTTNTTTAMEYQVYSVDGTVNSAAKWNECEKNMSLKEMVAEVLATESSAGKSAVVAIRRAETEKAPYSKTFYLTIPGQRIAPEAGKVSISQTATKYSIMISDASEINPYQYVVVKAGKEVEEEKLSWKNVSSSKEIKFTSTSYPNDSVIYIRLKGADKTTKKALQLPSAYTKLTISYKTETSEEKK